MIRGEQTAVPKPIAAILVQHLNNVLSRGTTGTAQQAPGLRPFKESDSL